MTKQMTLSMPDSLTIQKRKYETSHPWLRFIVSLEKVPPAFWLVLGECHSKCEHIAGVPIRPDVAKKLHRIYLAKGAHGTTAIEGNTLSEAEVLQHVEGKLEVSADKEYLKQEIDNIIQESNRMVERVLHREPLILSPDRIKEINRIVLKGLSVEEGVEPGTIRRYSVGVMNYRGAPHQDCEHLLARLCDWLNGPDFEPRAGLERTHMAILKSIIAHLYIEWIHAFGDGNGRTGRLVEVQILMAAGVPSPACHLLSNHYNLTRKEYLAQLRMASESGGDTIPFITYALNGLLTGLKGQLAHIRRLQMEFAWLNYVHDSFRHQSSKAAHRQKALLLDLFEKEVPIQISEIDQLSTRLAKAYAGMHPRTPARDVEALEARGLLIREGKLVRANQDLIAGFLPIKAIVT
jgi:Fic family protein